MILQHEGMYYWYGENKDTETINRHVDFIGISCYSSSDLEHWDNEGIVLAPMSQDPGHMLHTTKICERPRVFTISTQSNSSCTRTQIQVIILCRRQCGCFIIPNGAVSIFEKLSAKPAGQQRHDIVSGFGRKCLADSQCKL